MVEIEYFSPKIRNKVNHLSDKELESRHIKNSQNSIIEEQTFKMSIRFELSQNKICGCQISTWKNASYLQSLRKYKLKLQWDAATYLLIYFCGYFHYYCITEILQHSEKLKISQ